MAAFLDSLSPLRSRNFRVYLGGQTVSLVGIWMQVTAQSWVVWELSHSEVAIGVVSMLGFLPILLLGPWTGVVADRRDRRRVLLATQVAAMALAFVFAVLVQTGLVVLWHIFLLATALGAVSALDFPAQQAFLGDLSGMAQIRKAVVLNASVFQVSRIAGPALAGWAIASIGPASAFWANGVTFLAVIGSLLVVRAQQMRRPSSGKPLGEFREGLRFVRGRRRIQDLVAFSALITFFGITSIIILPAFTDEVLGGGPDVYGLLLASSGAGALAGTAVVAPLAARARRVGVMLTVSTLWSAAWLVAFSLSESVPLSLATLFLMSAAIPVILTTANGLVQFLAPPDTRGRLVTIFIMVSFGAQPIAAVLTGIIGQVFGSAAALRLNGLLLAAGALALIVARPELRRWTMDHEVHGPPRGVGEERPAAWTEKRA